jgi:hypothetical protein
MLELCLSGKRQVKELAGAGLKEQNRTLATVPAGVPLHVDEFSERK